MSLPLPIVALPSEGSLGGNTSESVVATPSSSALLPATAVRCAVLHSRSWEDLIVLPLLLAAAGPEGRGTFVELGGFTGEEGSQTWLLEKCFGWTGTLIEASPVNFAAMQRAGRNAQMVYGGVCQPAGNLTIAVGEEPSTVTGNLELMSKGFRSQWVHAHLRNVTVPCKPLMSLLAPLPTSSPASAQAALEGNPFTYLSLDVEGAEEMVLRTLEDDAAAVARFPFSVVLVEVNREDSKPAEALASPYTASTRRVIGMLKSAGLVQLPMGKVPGSENALFARPELGDPRWNSSHQQPNAAVRQVLLEFAAARNAGALSKRLSPGFFPHMGGKQEFAKRVAQGLFMACTVRPTHPLPAGWRHPLPACRRQSLLEGLAGGRTRSAPEQFGGKPVAKGTRRQEGSGGNAKKNAAASSQVPRNYAPRLPQGGSLVLKETRERMMQGGALNSFCTDHRTCLANTASLRSGIHACAPHPHFWVAAIVRAQAYRAAHWTAWHLALGASQVLLYDNGQNAGLELLGAHPAVKIIPWAIQRPDAQVLAYDDALRRQATDNLTLVACIDIDEYLLPNNTQCMGPFIDRCLESPECAGLKVNTRVTDAALASRALRRYASPFALHRYEVGTVTVEVKSIVRASDAHYSQWRTPHGIYTKAGTCMFDENWRCSRGLAFQRRKSTTNEIALVHFHCTTLFDWVVKKAAVGRVDVSDRNPCNTCGANFSVISAEYVRVCHKSLLQLSGPRSEVAESIDANASRMLIPNVPETE